MSKRLQSIDLLRGIAIILVIFCHSRLNFPGSVMGWSGVDLFFVLSGFLVSGLLFTEYQKEASIHTGRFLIRRGFKIYPLFWFMLLCYFLIDFLMINIFSEYSDSFSWCVSCYVHELLFIQNYLPGRAFITWSLAIEEHFYLLLCLFTWIMVKRKSLENTRVFVTVCLVVIVLCNIMRALSVEPLASSEYTLSFLTHLRLDSLLFGVLLSYFYHFKQTEFTNIIRNYRAYWLMLAVACLSVTTYWQYTGNTNLLYTLGLTFLYVGYGLIMMLLITTENIEHRLAKGIFSPLVAVIATIGYYSYSIYLFHIIIANVFMPTLRRFITFPFYLAEFAVYFVTSIIAGIVISKIIELPTLKMRERFFPKKNQRAV